MSVGPLLEKRGWVDCSGAIGVSVSRGQEASFYSVGEERRDGHGTGAQKKKKKKRGFDISKFFI